MIGNSRSQQLPAPLGTPSRGRARAGAVWDRNFGVLRRGMKRPKPPGMGGIEIPSQPCQLIFPIPNKSPDSVPVPGFPALLPSPSLHLQGTPGDVKSQNHGVIGVGTDLKPSRLSQACSEAHPRALAGLGQPWLLWSLSPRCWQPGAAPGRRTRLPLTWAHASHYPELLMRPIRAGKWPGKAFG